MNQSEERAEVSEGEKVKKLVFRKLIQETMRLIRDYINTYSDNIPPRILRNIDEIFQNDQLIRFLVTESDLGQSFFTNLQLYVRARYAYLASLITQALASKRKPLFGEKLVLNYALKGYFPVAQLAQVRGISISGLRKALISLIHQREIKGSKRVIKKRFIPDAIQYILQKREKMHVVKSIILTEIKLAGGSCSIKYLTSSLGRPIHKNMALYRTIALIQLIRNKELELIRRNNEFIVKLSNHE